MKLGDASIANNETTKNRGLLIKEYFFLLDQVTACIFHREAAPHSQVVVATIDLVFGTAQVDTQK